MFLSAVFDVLPSKSPDFSLTAIILIGLVMVPPSIAPILLLLGVWGLTVSDPRATRTRQPLGLRRILRGIAALLAGCWPVGVSIYRLGRTSPNLVSGIAVLAAVLLMALVRTGARYLSWLARRIPDPRMAKRTESTARRFNICLALMLLAAVVSANPGGLITARGVLVLASVLTAVLAVVLLGLSLSLTILMGRYRRALQRSLGLARLIHGQGTPNRKRRSPTMSSDDASDNSRRV